MVRLSSALISPDAVDGPRASNASGVNGTVTIALVDIDTLGGLCTLVSKGGDVLCTHSPRVLDVIVPYMPYIFWMLKI